MLFIFIFYLSWNFIYVRWAGSSHSLDALVFTVCLTQLIHVCCCSHFQYGCLDPLACLVQSSVKKSFWVPLSLKISASWSMLHTLEKCRNCDLMLFIYLLVCIIAYVYFRLIKVNFPFIKGEGKRRKLSFPSTVDNFRYTFRSPQYSFTASYDAKNELKKGACRK